MKKTIVVKVHKANGQIVALDPQFEVWEGDAPVLNVVDGANTPSAKASDPTKPPLVTIDDPQHFLVLEIDEEVGNTRIEFKTPAGS